MKQPHGRRVFVARLGAIATGLGAFGAALLPESRARAATAKAASQVQSDATTAMPPSIELPIEVQNQLYSAALADASVVALVATLGTAGRIDPPTQTSGMTFSSGAQTQSVLLPIRSYSDGSTLAYVMYGTATGASVDRMACFVTATGGVLLGRGGQVYPYPVPDWNDAFFATLFPEQMADRIASTTVTSLDNTQTRPRLAAWRGERARMVKTMAVEGGGTPQQQICRNNCRGAMSTCLTIAGASGLAGIAAAGWCGICIIVAIGGTGLLPPVGVGLFIGCGWGCGSAIAGLTSFVALLALCRSNFQTCMANCAAMGGGPAQPQVKAI